MLRRLFLVTKLSCDKRVAGSFSFLSLPSPRATLLAECQMMTASSSGIKSEIKKCMQVKSANNNNNKWKPHRCIPHKEQLKPSNIQGTVLLSFWNLWQYQIKSWPVCAAIKDRKENSLSNIKFLYFLYTRLFLVKPRVFEVYKKIYIKRNNHFCLLPSSYGPTIFCITILQNTSQHSLVTTTQRTFNVINRHFFLV